MFRQLNGHHQAFINFRSYILSNTTRRMLIHFNTYFIILATCFGYVIAIIRPTRTGELALDAAISGMKHLFFASIIINLLTKLQLQCWLALGIPLVHACYINTLLYQVTVLKFYITNLLIVKSVPR
jgi:hypothetical protein